MNALWSLAQSRLQNREEVPQIWVQIGCNKTSRVLLWALTVAIGAVNVEHLPLTHRLSRQRCHPTSASVRMRANRWKSDLQNVAIGTEKLREVRRSVLNENCSP